MTGDHHLKKLTEVSQEIVRFGDGSTKNIRDQGWILP